MSATRRQQAMRRHISTRFPLRWSTLVLLVAFVGLGILYLEVRTEPTAKVGGITVGTAVIQPKATTTSTSVPPASAPASTSTTSTTSGSSVPTTTAASSTTTLTPSSTSRPSPTTAGVGGGGPSSTASP